MDFLFDKRQANNLSQKPSRRKKSGKVNLEC